MAPIRFSSGSRGAHKRRNASSKDDRARGVAFVSSRVEEPTSAASEDNDIVEDAGSVSGESSSDESTEPTEFFDALLHDLRSEERRSKPPKKKRKISSETKPLLNFDNGDLDDISGPSKESIGKLTADQMDEEDTDELVVTETFDDEPTEGDESPEDPFEIHFSVTTSARILEAVADSKEGMVSSKKSSFGRNNRAIFIKPNRGFIPSTLLQDGKTLPNQTVSLKSKLRSRAGKTLDGIGEELKPLLGLLFDYRDVLFCSRTPGNAKDLRNLTCLHALNHVLKTRDKVIKNNARLAKADPEDQTEYRDQGFTRPKVLTLLPTRQSCAKTIEAMVDLFAPEQQENKGRLNDSFSQLEEAISADKPLDFQDLFAGNDDDMFRLGLKITRKTIKFFSHFYNSDFIFASPLGLRMAIGSEGSKEFDRDFLSSIEVVIVDHADALLMQNWEHITFIFEHLNAQPKEGHGCDFSRVRDWYLEGHAEYLRQTIVLSSFMTPELNQIFNHNMTNIAGKYKISERNSKGMIEDLGINVKQSFSRFEASTPPSEPESRFRYFTNTMLTSLKKYARSGSGKPAGVLLFVPSYIDFLRVRNFLANSALAQDISFGAISEYTSVSETARARSHFLYGRHAVLLYTGRAHHFRRYRIRGVKKVIMYALPDNPLFYKEIAGGFLMQSISEGLLDQGSAVVRSIFSKWDMMKLEKVVGSERVASLIKAKGSTFDFQ